MRKPYSALDRNFEIEFFDERNAETNKLALSILALYENDEIIGIVRDIFSLDTAKEFYEKYRRIPFQDELNTFAFEQFKKQKSHFGYNLPKQSRFYL